MGRAVKMPRPEMADRQAEWARFRAWEERWNREGPQLDGEAAVRAVGEIVEFYLEVSGGSAAARQSVAAKAEAVRRLQHGLGFVALVR